MKQWIALFLGCATLTAVFAEEEVSIEHVWSKQFTVVVTEAQGKAIEEIVTTLGTSSVLSLGFKKSHLKALGKQLKGVGSLNFLGFIFSRSDLKMHMTTIQRSSLKWDGFIDGLKPGFEHDTQSGKLSEDLPGFAVFVGADYNRLSTDVQKKDWEGFVSSLIASSKSQKS